MKGILIYQPPDKTAQLPHFIDGLDPRLREKILLRVYQLSLPQKPELKEPHFKRFSLERYRDLCELRVKAAETRYDASAGAIAKNTGRAAGVPGARSRIQNQGGNGIVNRLSRTIPCAAAVDTAGKF